MEPWVVATSLIFLYLVATVVIGAVANRRLTVNMEDFLLYGRQAGVIVLYLTVVATFHSAFAFLGSGGFFYTHGIGFWVAGTWTVLVGVITYTLGTRIWALGKRFGYITPADMLADFYESDAVRVLTAVVSVVFTILYIQVQSQGLGYILSVASGGRVSFEVGTLILLIVAAAYLIAGGLRAVYWTDVIQGVWMYVAVWVGSLVLVYELFGGPVELWQRLATERPDLLTLPGPEGLFTPGVWFGMTIALSFGIVFQPHMMIRFYTAASARTLKWLGATTPIYLMTLYIPAAMVGLGGALVLPDLEVADRIFPGTALPVRSRLADGPHPGRRDRRRHVHPGLYPALQHDGAHPRHLPALRGAGAKPSALRDVRPRRRARAAGGGLRALGLDLRLPGDADHAVGRRRAATDAGDPGRLLSGPPVHHRAGVIAGIVAGLTTLYVTRVLVYQPLGIHEAIWSLAVNFAVTIIVSRVTAPPSDETRSRIHGEIERFVYGD